MNHRPLFSMPSVAEKMRNLKPDVPDPMLEEAKNDPSRLYLLKQVSYLNQQNVIGGEALDKLIEQAILTNGRVNNQEAITSAHQVTLDEYKRQTKRWHKFLTWFLGVLAAVVAPVGTVILIFALKKLGVIL